MATAATAESVVSDADDHPKGGAHGWAPRRRRRPLPAYDGSRPLVNPFHEQFAQDVALMSEMDALGKAGEDAYVAAGFARHRRNHIRMLNQELVARRIAYIRREREAAARAASMPPAKVIEELRARGIERFEDLVDRNAAGVVAVQDFSVVPVEVGIALLKMLHIAFAIRMPVV